MKLKEKEQRLCKNSMQKLSAMIVKFLISIEEETEGVGSSIRNAKRAIIKIAFGFDFKLDISDDEKMLVLFGVYAHELLHLLLTDFDYAANEMRKYPAYERYYRHLFANVTEDPAIEYQRSDRLSSFLNKALDASIAYFHRTGVELGQQDTAFAELVTALIQFGDIGYLKGYFKFKEAEECYIKIIPIMQEAIENPVFEERFKLSQDMYEIAKPLIEKHENELCSQSIINQILQSLGKSMDSGSTGKPVDPASAGNGGQSTDKSNSANEKRKKQIHLITKKQAEEMGLDKAEKSDSPSDADDIYVVIDDDKKDSDNNESSSASGGTKSDESNDSDSNGANSGGNGKSDSESSDSQSGSADNSSDSKEGSESGSSSSGNNSSEENSDEKSDMNGSRGNSSKEDSGEASDNNGSGNGSEKNKDTTSESGQASGSDNSSKKDGESNNESSQSSTSGDGESDNDSSGSSTLDSKMSAESFGSNSGNMSSTNESSVSSASNETENNPNNQGECATQSSLKASDISDSNVSNDSALEESSDTSNDSIDKSVGEKKDLGEEIKELNEKMSREESSLDDTELLEAAKEASEVIKNEEESETRQLKKQQKNLKAEQIDLTVESPYYTNISYVNRKIEDENVLEYNRIRRSAEMQKRILNLKASLKALFNEPRSKREYKTKGKLDKKRYATQRPTARLFYKDSKPDDRADMSIVIFVDQSGSMRGATDRVKEVVMLILEALQPFDVKIKVVGFTTNGNTVVYYHYGKTTDWTNNPSLVKTCMNINAGGGTFLGHALRYTGAMLKNRNERNKLFICITDGEPQWRVYRDISQGIKDCREAVSTIRRYADVIGVGLYYDKNSEEVFKKIFQYGAISMDDMDLLVKELPKKLKKFIKEV